MAKRKTDEEFKQEVYGLVRNEYTFIDKYVNTKTKLRVKHNKCSGVYWVAPRAFIQGNRCPYCFGNAKKTDKEFKQKVFDLVGNEYTFIDKYVNSNTKLRVKHNKCNFVYSVVPHSFLQGHRCPYCYGKVKKTDTQFKQEIYSLVGDEYIFLDKYVNDGTKLRVKHKECGNIYESTPTNFLVGHRCPYCINEGKRKTNEDFKREVYDLVGNEYTFLEPYVSYVTKIKVRHEICGNVYEVRPTYFLGGSRCPYCFGTVKKTDEQFRKEIYDLVGNEYTFLEPYQGVMTKIKVRHEICGNVYEVMPSNFLRGKRCPFCAGLIKKTDTQFKQEIYDLVGNEYIFLDKYINDRTKIKVRHEVCGNTYEVSPNNFLRGNRCPYSHTPKGETFISKILDKLSINYEYQKTFPDLKDGRLLSYDFYLPDKNILIEYQGIQHYQPVDIFGGEATFKKQQKHDQMKLDYAKSHGYNLITVPYTEDTLSKIKKYLVKHGLKK